jgi:hypothetical protein
MEWQQHMQAKRPGHARGVLATRRYAAVSVAVRMRKCVTPSGPAMLTKSFSWLRLDSCAPPSMRLFLPLTVQVLRQAAACRVTAAVPGLLYVHHRALLATCSS